MTWSVYIIECDDGSFYTGISTDVHRRFLQHGAGQGAKYFRARRPLKVIYAESGHTRSSASRREAAIKTLSRVEKMELIVSESVQ
ncbi:MAG: endonuclease [Proteobacteria bacterium ST_bin11]|nr:MAG: endonuclease [Proteobacteria bacterium ST_bin11]